MEFLWRYAHEPARLEHFHDAGPVSPPPSLSSSSLLPRDLHHLYRRLLLAVTILAFLAHALVFALPHSQNEGQLVSNLLQFILGIAACLAMAEAAWRSQGATRWAWYYASAAIATYTAGQLVFIGYTLFARGPRFAPRITDQFFFFWVVPLLAASLIARLRREDGFDSTVLLDLSQLLILAVALHVWVFSDAARWQSHPQQMEFLKVKVRVARDAVVLAWLLGTAWFLSSRQLRNLFVRLGAFYALYSVVDGIYLYVEAARQVAPGTWFDLLWSLPRVAAVALAVTWKWQEERIPARAPAERKSRVYLRMAPAFVPLAMLVISFHTFSSAPAIWATLIMASFGIAGVRLLVMQSRQEQILADLHNSHELLHSIIEGTSEAIYLKDQEGRYKLINSAGARYMGRTANDVLGKTDRELLSPQTMEPIVKIDHDVLSKGESVTCEEKLIEKGGTRTFLSTKNPYRDSDGRVTGVLGISVDITEHRRIEEQLRRAQRMESIGAFSGAIAHDFNNVLTVIKGYTQISQSRLQDPILRGNLEQIEQATDRAAALIRQLLAFGRQQVFQLRVINLNDTIVHMHRMLERLIGEDVEIISHLASELWAVKADPGQIEQVLMNLAANARDAMRQGGKLILETANADVDEFFARAHVNIPAGNYATISVTDTGAGMDAQTLSRVFEPFFTTKPAGQGTGLGLATCYGIVKQSGGYILAESKPGVGSTFKVYLPRVEQPIQYQVGRTAGIGPDNRESAGGASPLG